MVTAFAKKGTFYTNFTSQGNLMQDLQQDFREGTFPCKSPALAKFVARLALVSDQLPSSRLLASTSSSYNRQLLPRETRLAHGKICNCHTN